MNYNQHHIRNWLIGRPLISIRALEDVSGCPRGTIRHFLKERRNISESYLESIGEKLSDYGFVPLGEE